MWLTSAASRPAVIYSMQAVHMNALYRSCFLKLYRLLHFCALQGKSRFITPDMLTLDPHIMCTYSSCLQMQRTGAELATG